MNIKVKSELKVPFFDYPSVFKEFDNQLTHIFNDVCSKGAYILQKELDDFEKNLAHYSGCKYALGVANGTDALIIALRAAGIKEGDEVIFSTHTYVATAAAIHFVGAIPIPVECGEDHMIDVTKIEDAISTKTTAIMPTQLNGRCSDMDTIQSICDKHNLILIEDAAQALGATYKGKCAGTFGAAGTISFYPAKTLGCFGDGGAILTNDDEMYQKMYELRDHGRNKDGEVVSWGLNSRLDNLQAAVLDFKLKHYNNFVKRRREIANIYHEELSGLEQLFLPPRPDDVENATRFDVFQNYEIEADNRDGLQQFLKDNNIGSIIQWAGKCVHQFEGLNIQANLPFSENMISKSLLLPMFPTLSNEQIYKVCDCIKEFYR